MSAGGKTSAIAILVVVSWLKRGLIHQQRLRHARFRALGHKFPVEFETQLNNASYVTPLLSTKSGNAKLENSRSQARVNMIGVPGKYIVNGFSMTVAEIGVTPLIV